MSTWTADQLGDLGDVRALVTGANSGIGFEAAKMLAGAGATVTLACRNQAKGERAADEIRAAHPHAAVDVLECDLADLGSVEKAAVGFRGDHLDVLINNAGVMALPYRQTADGFEMQFGTNHLGHFALTARLFERLLAAGTPRVVTVSSGMHRLGRISFGNLDGSKGYRKWPAYSQSKLANLLFTFELDRRARAAGLPLVAVAAHPGYAETSLQATGPRMAGSKLRERFMHVLNGLVAQDPAAGALPTVYAAAGPDIRSGDYIGPDGIGELRGSPKKVRSSRAARHPGTAHRLWEVSEQLTGVRFAELPPA